MKELIKCPICSNLKLEILYSNKVPLLQNRVYNQLLEAINAGQGQLKLVFCDICNFTFNGAFDDSLIEYDENYNNNVPSRIFEAYYIEICRYLKNKYSLENSFVLDIGCGKGTFLKLMCKLFPKIKGIGIDPSYDGELNPLTNLTFVKDFFDVSHINFRPDLIISRHVFEHIPNPKDFLILIKEPVSIFKDIPIFIEVPDFLWIVKNQTFWDLCYEHCNYFSQISISQLFNNSWSKLTAISKGFGGQYMWIEGVINPSTEIAASKSISHIELEEIKQFVESIELVKNNAFNFINQYKAEEYTTVVWGMATKGVIFANEIDRNRELIDFCIDVNIEKQGKFIPVSGHLIQSPDILRGLLGIKILIVIMNANYQNEIRQLVSEIGLRAVFTDAHGKII